MPASGKIRTTSCRFDASAAATSDDGDALAMPRERTEPLVIVECPEIDHLITTPGEPARRAAGRQQEPVEGKDCSPVIGQALPLRVERLCRAAEHELDTQIVEVNPDLVEWLALPEPLAKQRAFVRWSGVGANQADRGIRIDRTKTAHGCGGRHAPAEDEIRIVRHRFLR